MFSFTNKISHKAAPKKSFLQNPKILEVNLIKDEAIISFDWNKNILVLVLVLFLAGLLVLEVYFGLDWWQKQEVARLEPTKVSVSEANAAAAKLKNETAAALSYKDKSVVFSELLDNHVYWNNFFSWLERKTLSTVKFSGFSGGLDGNYVLTATAPSYADVSWQVKAFLDDPLTKKIEVSSVSSGKTADKTKAGQLNFILTLQIDPTIFKK